MGSRSLSISDYYTSGSQGFWLKDLVTRFTKLYGSHNTTDVKLCMFSLYSFGKKPLGNRSSGRRWDRLDDNMINGLKEIG
jgi:hypothetical protein